MVVHETLPTGREDNDEMSGYALGSGSADQAWGRGQDLADDGSNDSNLAMVRLAPKRGLAHRVTVSVGDERAERAVHLVWDLVRDVLTQ